MGVKSVTACHVVGMHIVLPKHMLSCSHRSFQNHCELHHILGVHVFIISWKIVFNGLVGFDTFHSSVAFERHKCPFCKDALVVQAMEDDALEGVLLGSSAASDGSRRPRPGATQPVPSRIPQNRVQAALAVYPTRVAHDTGLGELQQRKRKRSQSMQRRQGPQSLGDCFEWPNEFHSHMGKDHADLLAVLAASFERGVDMLTAWACRSHSVAQSAVAWQSLATWSRAPHRTPHSLRRRALAIGKGSCGRGRRRGAIQGTCAWKGCESEGWFAWRGLMTPILFTCAGMLCMWVSLGACGIHSLGDLTPLCFFRANRSDSI